MRSNLFGTMSTSYDVMLRVQVGENMHLSFSYKERKKKTPTQTKEKRFTVIGMMLAHLIITPLNN